MLEHILHNRFEIFPLTPDICRIHPEDTATGRRL